MPRRKEANPYPGLSRTVRRFLKGVPDEQLAEMRPIDIYEQLKLKPTGSVRTVTSIELKKEKERRSRIPIGSREEETTAKSPNARDIDWVDVFERITEIKEFVDQYESWNKAKEAIRRLDNLCRSVGGADKLILILDLMEKEKAP